MSLTMSTRQKHGSQKPLSTLLQEIIQSSTLGCLSTCEAVRALRRLAPPMLKDTPTIRLRKKITDCLTRNPAFSIAHDHLRHGIRPRYALRNTDVAAEGCRLGKKREQKLNEIKNCSYAHSIKTGDKLLREAVEGPIKKNIRRQQKSIEEKGIHNYNRDVYVSQSSPTTHNLPNYAYFTNTPRFPKVNFPDLTSTHFDIMTTPERSQYYTHGSTDQSPIPYNTIYPSSTIFPDYNQMQCNLLPFLTPPTSPENTISFLPNISSDEVIQCLTLF